MLTHFSRAPIPAACGYFNRLQGLVVALTKHLLQSSMILTLEVLKCSNMFALSIALHLDF